MSVATSPSIWDQICNEFAAQRPPFEIYEETEQEENFVQHFTNPSTADTPRKLVDAEAYVLKSQPVSREQINNQQLYGVSDPVDTSTATSRVDTPHVNTNVFTYLEHDDNEKITNHLQNVKEDLESGGSTNDFVNTKIVVQSPSCEESTEEERSALKSNEQQTGSRALQPQESNIPDHKTCLPADYLNYHIYPILLPALEAMLRAAEKENCFVWKRVRFNSLDFLTEYLYSNNPRYNRDVTELGDIPFVAEHWKEHPRPPLPKSLIWTEEESTLIIQSYWRGYQVRIKKEVQELRQWQKEWREENDSIRNKVNEFWDKKMPNTCEGKSLESVKTPIKSPIIEDTAGEEIIVPKKNLLEGNITPPLLSASPDKP